VAGFVFPNNLITILATCFRFISNAISQIEDLPASFHQRLLVTDAIRLL